MTRIVAIASILLLGMARRNGVTQEELVGAITHLAFYTGWPNAVTAVSVAREVFHEN